MRSAAGFGAGRGRRSSVAKPSTALVKASAIHEKVRQNRTTSTSWRAVGLPETDTVSTICQPPKAVSARAPPNTRIRSGQGVRTRRSGR